MSLRESPQLGNRARATGGRFGNASARNGALSCFQVVTSNWQSYECQLYLYFSTMGFFAEISNISC